MYNICIHSTQNDTLHNQFALRFKFCFYKGHGRFYAISIMFKKVFNFCFRVTLKSGWLWSVLSGCGVCRPVVDCTNPRLTTAGSLEIQGLGMRV